MLEGGKDFVMGWAIALHGGASDIPPSIPSHLKDTAHAALCHSLDVGTSALASSSSALDVAELVVRELENSPAFNAGRGSVLTTEGTIEMDACIMDGSTKNCGAVSGLSTVVNPISLARLVMEKTPHVYLAFQGAEDFAKERGVLTADMNYFITKENEKRLLQAKAANSVELDHSKYATTNGFLSTTENGAERIRIGGTDNSVEHIAIGPIGETVGCVVVDSQGACAAATSTGGLVNKMVGRIGDTPIVGAGTYANKLCAVSATGQGEFIIRSTMARDVAALLEYKGVSLAEAVNEVVEKHVPKGTAGLVAVSSSGEIAMAFNTTGMFRACADESGYSKIAIWN